jgi:hypothetical protein
MKGGKKGGKEGQGSAKSKAEGTHQLCPDFSQSIRQRVH